MVCKKWIYDEKKSADFDLKKKLYYNSKIVKRGSLDKQKTISLKFESFFAKQKVINDLVGDNPTNIKLAKFIDVFQKSVVNNIENMVGQSPKSFKLIEEHHLSVISNIIPPIVVIKVRIISDTNNELLIALPKELSLNLCDMMMGKREQVVIEGDLMCDDSVDEEILDTIKDIIFHIITDLSDNISEIKNSDVKFEILGIDFIDEDSEYSLGLHEKMYVFNMHFDDFSSFLMLIFDYDSYNLLFVSKLEVNEEKDIKEEDVIPQVEEKSVNLIKNAKLDIRVRVGKKFLPLSVVKKIGPDFTLALDQLANDPLEVLVQNQIIGLGEVVIVDGNFGIQLTKIYDDAIEDKSFYSITEKDKFNPMLLVEVLLGEITVSVDEILLYDKGSILDLLIHAGTNSKMYADKVYIGDVSIIVFEKFLGINYIDSNKGKSNVLPELKTEDREKFKLVNSDVKNVEILSSKEAFLFLNNLTCDTLFEFLKFEHPQTIAVAILNIDNMLAKDVLNLFDKDDSREIIMRISRLTKISDESLIIVSNTLKENYETKINQVNIDGLVKVTDILILCKEDDTKEYIESISELDEDLSEIIEKGVNKKNKD